MERLNMSQFMAVCFLIATVSMGAKADTSYTPAPPSGGPYPASGVPESDAGTSSANAPYPASNWKPAGRLLVLPARATTAQAVSSTKKCVTNGRTAPATVTENEFTTEEAATSPKPEPESENINESISGQQHQTPIVPDSGIYYVLLPDGRLQKVTYSTMPLVRTPSKLQSSNAAAVAENEVPNGYTANVKYQDVEPVRGPIYAYSAAPLIRIFK